MSSRSPPTALALPPPAAAVTVPAHLAALACAAPLPTGHAAEARLAAAGGALLLAAWAQTTAATPAAAILPALEGGGAQGEGRKGAGRAGACIRQILWALFRNLISQFGGFFPTVYKAVPSRDRAVTETTIVLQLLFCNPPKTWGIAKLELRNNSCFAIEKQLLPSTH